LSSHTSQSQIIPKNDPNLGAYLCDLLIYDAQLAGRISRENAAAERFEQARALSRPTVDLFARSTSFETMAFGDSDFGAGSSSLTGGAVASLPLYRSGGNKASRSAAASRLDATKQGTNIVRQELLKSGVDAYLNILLQQAILDIQEANVTALKTQEVSAQARFDIGRATRTDIDQALASLRSAEAALISAKQIKQNAEINFQRLFGQLPEGITNPKLNRLGVSTVEQLIDLSLRENPAVLEQKFLSLAAQEDVNIRRSDRGLRSDVELRYQQTRKISGSTFNTDGASLGISFTLPLISGGALKSRERESRALANEQVNKGLDLARTVSAQAQIAWGNLAAAKRRVSLVNEQQEAAAKAFKGAIEEQRLGRRVTFEVLNIQNTLITSRLSAARANIELIRAQIEIAQLTGQIEKLVPGMNPCPAL